MLLADGGIIFLSVLKLGGVSWHLDGRKEVALGKHSGWDRVGGSRAKWQTGAVETVEGL